MYYVTHAGRHTTRLILASIATAGACVIALGGLSAPDVGAAGTLTLTETWNAGAGIDLNDAPCGIGEASPVEFNDGGAAAVEVGDRQGDLYGLNLFDGSIAPGLGQRPGPDHRVGPGLQQPRHERGRARRG